MWRETVHIVAGKEEGEEEEVDIFTHPQSLRHKTPERRRHKPSVRGEDPRSTTFGRAARFHDGKRTPPSLFEHMSSSSSSSPRRSSSTSFGSSTLASLPRDRRFRKVRNAVGSQTGILGPGAYTPTFVATETSAPSCRFSTSGRLFARESVGDGGSGGPGPVTNLNVVRTRSSAAVFGSAARRTLPRMSSTAGGGGSFEARNFAKATAKASPAYSFAGPYERPPRATQGRTLMRKCSPIFGYGCSVEEHLKYGKCLDGKCGRRAPWERRRVLVTERESSV